MLLSPATFSIPNSDGPTDIFLQREVDMSLSCIKELSRKIQSQNRILYMMLPLKNGQRNMKKMGYTVQQHINSRTSRAQKNDINAMNIWWFSLVKSFQNSRHSKVFLLLLTSNPFSGHSWRSCTGAFVARNPKGLEGIATSVSGHDQGLENLRYSKVFVIERYYACTAAPVQRKIDTFQDSYRVATKVCLLSKT